MEDKYDSFKRSVEIIVEDNFCEDYCKCYASIQDYEKNDLAKELYEINSIDDRKKIIKDIIDRIERHQDILDQLQFHLEECLFEYFKNEINDALFEMHEMIRKKNLGR